MAGSLLLLANWPFTMLAIMPVNKRLMAMTSREAGAESRGLLRRWGSLQLPPMAHPPRLCGS